MKRWISVLCAALMVLSCLALTACDNGTKGNDASTESKEPEKQVLRVGMECDYAPFNWTQTEKNDRTVAIKGGGYADGYDVQIARKIADGLDMELQIVKLDWASLEGPALNAGQIDLVVAGMSPLADRKETIDFSDYYYSSDLVIVVRKDGAFANAKELSDFGGAKITGQLGTFHYTVIDQIEGVSKQTAMETFPDMVVALSSGKIDGYISERPGALSAVASNSDLTFVAFDEGKGFTYNTDQSSISVGLKKGSDLTAKVNEVLATISDKERAQMMDDAIANQPLSEE